MKIFAYSANKSRVKLENVLLKAPILIFQQNVRPYKNSLLFSLRAFINMATETLKPTMSMGTHTLLKYLQNVAVY